MTALPTRKLEAWRYTDLKSLGAISFAEPKRVAAPADLPDFGLPRLVFVNGAYDDAASTPPAFFQTFDQVYETSSLPLALINAAHARDGATLHIPAGQEGGSVLVVSYASGDDPVAFHPRHRISLGENATLTMIEVSLGHGVYWHNQVTDITLHDGASLSHYRLQAEGKTAFHLATIRADVAANARYDGFTATIGAKISRAEYHMALTGPEASVQVNAVQLLGGHQVGDVTTVIQHQSPNGASRQTVKSVLSDHARGVFQGRIEVDRIAQKTDGYQMNQALLLSPTAEMDIKPELQIFADDVKCSHGATIGALDPEQIFYLRSRGIPEDAARAMLIRAFLTEALDAVTDEAARAMFESAIEDWWINK
jgi:Fe-S cluster assembly protein SufD